MNSYKLQHILDSSNGKYNLEKDIEKYNERDIENVLFEDLLEDLKENHYFFYSNNGKAYAKKDGKVFELKQDSIAKDILEFHKKIAKDDTKHTNILKVIERTSKRDAYAKALDLINNFPLEDCKTFLEEKIMSHDVFLEENGMKYSYADQTIRDRKYE